jgi:hypothetical protein
VANTTAPPANDDCANPTPLACPATITQDTTEATGDGPSDCASANFNSVWFSFTGDGAQHTLSTTGSNYDTVLEVFIGPCDDLTSVACNDDEDNANGILTSRVTFTATAGTTYLVRVTSFEQGGGNLTLAHSGTACPCTLTCPANITVSASAQCSAVVNYPAPTTSGNCGPVTCTPPSGSTFPLGTTTVTCTEGAILDLSQPDEGAASVGASCSFTVTVNDTTPPSITCPASITTSAGAACNAVVNYTPPTPTDNCPGVTVTCNPPSGSTFPKGTTTVTCTATDGAGNTASCSFTVTVNDAIPPVLNGVPANATVQCLADVPAPANVTATDNCDTITPTFTETMEGTCPKIITRTWRAEDAAGNSTTATRTVTVNDTIPPVLSGVPGNITVQCLADAPTDTVTATDNCDGTIPVTFTETQSNPGSSCNNVITRTWRAEDACGNSVTATRTITVNDTTPPVITCPANQTVSAGADCTATVNPGTATATDNCGVAPTIAGTRSDGRPLTDPYPLGTTTITWKATDQCNNMASCSQTVTVNDTTPPVITCPANITQSTDPGVCTAVVNWAALTVSDNCPNVGAPVCTPPSGSTFQKGTTTVTCTVADNAGNVGRCSFTVTVNDTEPPKLTCPADIFVGTAGNSQLVSYTVPVATDNCPNVGAVTCSPPSGSAFPLGVTNVTCSVQDASGNAARCNFQITVNKVAFSIADPLVCAGTVVNGVVTISNNGNVPQDVVSVTSLPPGQLLALDGTCAATSGTCAIPDASTVRWTGALAPGQTVTITFKAQVDDQVLPGTRLCATTRVSFNGGPILSVESCVTTDCPLPGPGNPPVARSPISDQKGGSVLIWPIYTSSLNNPVVENTRINITNTDVTRGVFVHLFFVDGSNCSVADSYLCLTPNQTATLLASDIDPGVTGYAVAVAVNGATGCPINFNHLIGDEYVKFASGHAANLGAEAFAAIAGGLPRCDATSTTATLNFDGVSYNQAPRVLAADSIPSLLDNNSTMLIINRVGGNLATTAGNIGPLFGLVYDALENPYSFNFSARCQFRDFLNNTTFPRTTPRLNAIIPAGSTGWMKLNPTDDVGILGAIIVANPNAPRDANSYAQGRNLHKLTFTRTASYTIPVFPARCQ